MVRIGMVNYLNMAPIYEKWKSSVMEQEWTLVEAPPACLNTKLSSREIDLGFVSCFEYANHPDKYKILSGLSISANGPVGSVFLFSNVPLDQLGGSHVLLTAESATSVRLVKIVLEEFHSVSPEYTVGALKDADLKEFEAVLAIGDDALRLVDTSSFLYQFDLGDIWKRETGLPFVFAVCAVQQEFCDQHPEVLGKVHQELLRCRDEGVEDLDTICDISASRIPMERDRCHAYLKAIEYDLSQTKREALERFFQYLIDRGEIDSKALPLKIISCM